MIKKLDLRLLRLLKKQKGQVIAIVMVIVLGLMIYVAMNSAFINLTVSLEYHHENHHFADIYAEVFKISDDQVKKVSNLPGVKSTEGRFVFDVPFIHEGDEKVNVRLMTSTFTDINTLHALEGQASVFNGNQCLVIDKFAAARQISVGDSITVHVGGKDVDIEVSGVVSSPEFVYLIESEQSLLPSPGKFGVVYVSEKFIQNNLGETSYNEVLFTIDKQVQIESMINRLEDELDEYGLLRIYDKEDQLSNNLVHQELKGVEQTAQSVPVIFLGVAGVILIVMINRLVKNDRVVIGLLKSMGYSNKKILMHYTKLSLVIGLVGGIFGVIFGFALSVQFTAIYNEFFSIPTLRFLFRPELIVSAVFLISTFSIASGLIGARRAIKIQPAMSMRPEPPKVGKRILIEKLKIWQYVKFSNKMVLRNLFRNKKRAVFITLGIVLTFSITLVPFFMVTAFQDLFSTMFGEFQTMDYNMNFSQGMHQNVLKDIEAELPVDHVEGKIEFPFNLSFKHFEKPINIIGLEANTAFFNFTNIENETVYLNKNDFFISEGFANVLNVSKGDEIRIESFIPDRDDAYIIVTEIIKQNLGANAYMLQEDMYDTLIDTHYINGAYIDTHEDITEAVDKWRQVSSVLSLEDMKGSFEEFLTLTITSLSILIIFAGILGFAIVYNSTIMTLNERRLEFSSLRVMGFTKNELMTQVYKEHLIMTLIGIVFGVPVSRWMLESLKQTFTTELYAFEVNINMMHLLGTSIALMIFVHLALAAAYRKIHHLDFIEALKNRLT